MRIEILKWVKRYPRADYKTMPWLKLDSSFYRNPKLFGVPVAARWTCVTLFCIAAEENKGGVIEADPEWLADQAKVPLDDFLSSVEVLASKNLITTTYVSRTADVREPSASRSLEKRREEKRERRERDLKVSPPNSPPKGGSRGAQSSPPHPFDLEMADAWAAYARTHVPSIKVDQGKWANAIRQMRELDGLTESDIRATLAFVEGDDFWKTNALSPVAVRGRSKNGLKKIENIRLRMKETGATGLVFGSPEYWAEVERIGAERDARGEG